LAAKKVIAYKIPNIVPFLKKYLEIVPSANIVFMRRNPVDTINSLMKKGWFSDHSLQTENRIYPFTSKNDHCIPYWVAQSDYDYWMGLNELDRCAYYYIRMCSPPKNKQLYTIDYDSFLKSPSSQIGKFCEYNNLEFGKLTSDLLNSIKLSQLNRDENIISKISPRLRDVIKSSLKS
jgi:hypothetical protein